MRAYMCNYYFFFIFFVFNSNQFLASVSRTLLVVSIWVGFPKTGTLYYVTVDLPLGSVYWLACVHAVYTGHIRFQEDTERKKCHFKYKISRTPVDRYLCAQWSRSVMEMVFPTGTNDIDLISDGPGLTRPTKRTA